MEPSRPPSFPSRAAVRGHPIHPMLVPFPIAFLAAAPVTDLLLIMTTDAYWGRASFHLLLAGLGLGALAALFGLVDFSAHAGVRKMKAAWVHLLGNLTVLTLTAINLVLRVDDRLENVLPYGVVLSVLAASLLVLTGWMGGEMVYRHRVGVEGR